MERLRADIYLCPFLIASSSTESIALETYYLIPSKFDDELVTLKSYTILSILSHPIKWAFTWPRRFNRTKITYTSYRVVPHSHTATVDTYRLHPTTRSDSRLSRIWRRLYGARRVNEIVVWRVEDGTRVFLALVSRRHSSTAVVMSNSKGEVHISDRTQIESMLLGRGRTVLDLAFEEK